MQPQNQFEAVETLAQERNKITPGNDMDQLSYVPGSDDESDSLHEENSDSDQQKEITSILKTGKQDANQVGESEAKLKCLESNLQKSDGGTDNQEGAMGSRRTDKQPVGNCGQPSQAGCERPQGGQQGSVQGERSDKKQQKVSTYQKTLSRQLKYYDHAVDSKFIYAIRLLFLKEIQAFIPTGQGYIKCNPYVNSKTIKIGYYDKKALDEVVQKLEDFIEEIEVIEMNYKEGESRSILSRKYQAQLLKQGFAIFRDMSSRHKNIYLCGKYLKKELLGKLTEIRKTCFACLHLFRYPDTRSYRKILSIIFQTPDIRSIVKQKFSAKEIQVTKCDRSVRSNHKQKGVRIVLTIPWPKKFTVHQQIEEILVNSINEIFYFFCFSFYRESLTTMNKFVPNAHGITFFYIHEKHIRHSYICALVKQQNYKQLRQRLMLELLNMKLEIRGQRFFKGFPPALQIPVNKKYMITQYPPVGFKYSQTVSAPLGTEFDLSTALL